MPVLTESGTLSQKPRARRFRIKGKIRYRTGEEPEWLEGEIKDMSKSGVLFLAAHSFKNNQRIEMRLMLMQSAKIRVEVACTGKIAREAAAEAEMNVRAVAATIARYRFVRRPRAPQSSLS